MNKKTNWTGICATENNRNQCTEECTMFPICKIKVPNEEIINKIKTIIRNAGKSSIINKVEIENLLMGIEK